MVVPYNPQTKLEFSRGSENNLMDCRRKQPTPGLLAVPLWAAVILAARAAGLVHGSMCDTIIV